jgi:hypothetical protein
MTPSGMMQSMPIPLREFVCMRPPLRVFVEAAMGGCAKHNTVGQGTTFIISFLPWKFHKNASPASARQHPAAIHGSSDAFASMASMLQNFPRGSGQIFFRFLDFR